MDMSNLANCMGTLFLLLALGLLCNKTGLLSDSANRVLSRLVINVALPATTIDSIVNTDLSLSGETAAELMASMGVYYGVMVVLGLVLSTLIAHRHPEKRLYQFMITFGNIGFLGFPLITSLFGSEALFYVAVYNIPFNLLIYTYGIVLICGKSEGKIAWKEMLNPPLIASVVAVGLLLMGVHLPTAAADAVARLGDMTVPGAMLVVGASLGSVPGGALWREWRLYATSALTLLLRPVVVFLLMRLFVTDPVILGTGVMLSAVPVAANTTVLCMEYHAHEALASCGVFITTVLSMATIPLIAILLF